MELITIILLSVLIVLMLVFITIQLTKKNNDKNDDLKLHLQKENSQLKQDIIQLINDKNTISERHINKFGMNLGEHLENKLNSMNEKINTKIIQNSRDNNTTFTKVIERLTKIDETQKYLKTLSEEVTSLNYTLNDKKSRGTFGEIQLNQILDIVFGKNTGIFEVQKKLSNNKIVDAILYAPKPLGAITIDSKFPLENYNRLIDKEKTKEEFRKIKRDFKNDIKKHINDISSKYIINGETSNNAIMFIPSESIFLEIVNNFSELITYAYNNKIWIVSPTTLISTLTVIQVANSNLKQAANAEEILEELKLLGTEFERFSIRWEALVKQSDTLTSNISKIHITSNKIIKRFDSISNS